MFSTLFLKKVGKKFGGFVESLYLCTRKRKTDAPVAQLVEHLTLNQGVQGSNPCGCTEGEEERLAERRSLFVFMHFIICARIKEMLNKNEIIEK